MSQALHERIYKFIKKHLDRGFQAYIVCPLVEEGDSDLIPAQEYYKLLQNTAFRGYRLGLLHGQMKPKEKDNIMRDFESGKIQLLVSTVVVEVGVDVPNAVVMVIENAERFGLSQLHQLRGRVGRGAEQSYCVLVSSYKLSNETRKRLEIMVSSNNGFEIAEADLRLRGHGDLEGTRQSGEGIDLKIANLAADGQILQYARDIAQEVLNEDPDLLSEPNRILNERLKTLFAKKVNWGMIS